MTSTNSNIRHPRPDNRSTQSSNRLLSPHLSVLEALRSTHDDGDNKNVSNHQTSPFSPQFNSLENHQNTPTFNDFEFNAASSWQSIGDYLAPRPTSSVLSSSDTEEDDINPAEVSQKQNIGDTVTMGSPLAIEQRHLTSSDSDEKTIEIDMNGPITRPTPVTEGSSFVLPQMFNHINADGSSNSKILIIGHKRVSFLHNLDHHLQGRFTLDNNDNYNIILVIFDGLIKIGNILNFIKYNSVNVRDKLFIPIFRNINMKIIDKILRNYNINLLCSPINLDNKYEVNNLLNVLKEDYLLKDSSMITPLQNNQIAIEQTMNSYQLIRISSSENEDLASSSEPSNDEARLLGDTTNLLNLQGGEVNDKKIVMIQNTPYEIIHHKSSKKPKKLRNRDRIYRKYLLLGISLTVGIGIGVTTALTVSFLKSRRPVSPQVIHQSQYKKLTSFTMDQLKNSNSLMKKNLIFFKQHVGDLSKIVYHHSKDYVCKVGHLWDQFVISASQGVQSGAMLWYF